MQEMSEEKVLLLGYDTYVLKNGEAVLPDLLDNFDIAASHVNKTRIVLSHTHGLVPDFPVAFPKFNCDIILDNNTQAVQNFY